MIISNYHSHFKLDDGIGELWEYVEFALKHNINIIGTSPHAPVYYKNEWTMTERGFEQYLKESCLLKEKYRDNIEIYTGLEIDYIEKKGGPNSLRWNNTGLDYKIGSVHSMEDPESGQELTVDGPIEDIEMLIKKRCKGDVKLFVKDYFKTEKNMIAAGGFDIIGHCDLIKKRNSNNRFFDQKEKWYKAEANELLVFLAESDIVVEVNTGGISRGAINEVYPSPWMLKRCLELNIPVTLSSDAHSPQHLNFYFNESLELLKLIGYGEIYFFSRKKWHSQALY